MKHKLDYFRGNAIDLMVQKWLGEELLFMCTHNGLGNKSTSTF
jgi:hypothetical protein